jgi:predicted DNA-binding transcriptional regulator AlpA
MRTKKKPASVKSLPSPPLMSHPMSQTLITEPRKLVTADAVEKAIDLKKPALYRLVRANRIPVYKLGRERGLRFIVDEVLAAIRQAPTDAEAAKASDGKKD